MSSVVERSITTICNGVVELLGRALVFSSLLIITLDCFVALGVGQDFLQLNRIFHYGREEAALDGWQIT